MSAAAPGDRGPGTASKPAMNGESTAPSECGVREGVVTGLEVLDWKYRQLPAPIAGLYRVMGRCPARWLDRNALAAILGCSNTEAHSAAQYLLAKHLVLAVDYASGDGEPVVDGPRIALGARRSLHAASLCAETEDAAGLERWIAYMLGTAAVIGRRADPDRLAPQRHWQAPDVTVVPFDECGYTPGAWLRDQRPNFVALVRWASEVGRWELAYTLVAVWWPLFAWHRPAESVEVVELALSAARAVDDVYGQAHMMLQLAGLVREADPARAARPSRKAEGLAEREGEPRLVAQALCEQGWGALSAEYVQAAGDLFVSAETVFEQHGDARGQGRALHGLARVQAAHGHGMRAAAGLLEARAMLTGAGETFETQLIAIEVGAMLAAIGDVDRALAEIGLAADALTSANQDYGLLLAVRQRATLLEAAGRGSQAADEIARIEHLRRTIDPPIPDIFPSRSEAAGE